MVKDASGREGISAGGLAKELGVSPAQVKKALVALDLPQPDFVKAGCGYYYAERLPALKAAIK